MNISILTTGTRGDTQPYIAIALTLQDMGHTVIVAASEGLTDIVSDYGLRVHPVRGDVTKIAAGELAEKARSADNPLKFFRSMKNKEFTDLLVRMHEDLYAACSGTDAVVYHPGAAAGCYYARENDVPAILASPFPMTATREYPSRSR